ncbi:hypothetical protein SAMN05443669_10612 [Flavobacterium xanthum]|uniref:Uncharacterized protein n=2 Tax=Flavobacterium xanthum TaxID=69322 RepID=A0A1M7L2D5_9FLAO|nr:hypothetical protein SAMN05443669_10612 [Flavobacterium xanthum]
MFGIAFLLLEVFISNAEGSLPTSYSFQKSTNTSIYLFKKNDYNDLNPVRFGIIEKASHYIYSNASNYVL